MPKITGKDIIEIIAVCALTQNIPKEAFVIDKRNTFFGIKHPL